jgi:hypothetical protein
MAKVRLEDLDSEDFDYTADDEDDSHKRNHPNEKSYYSLSEKRDRRNEKNYRSNKRNCKKEIQEAFINARS